MASVDLLDKFCSVRTSFVDSREAIPERAKDYPFFEEYDAQKQYVKEPFQQDFGQGLLWYQYHLGKYKLPDDTILMYVVAEETEANLTPQLQAHCQCEACVMASSRWSWLMWPLGLLFGIGICACCVGCLKSGMAQQHQINKARAHMMASMAPQFLG